MCVLCIPHWNVSQQQLLCGVMCISIFHSGASKAAAVALNYINTNREGSGGSVIKDTNSTHTDGQLLTCRYVPAWASAGGIGHSYIMKTMSNSPGCVCNFSSETLFGSASAIFGYLSLLCLPDCRVQQFGVIVLSQSRQC